MPLFLYRIQPVRPEGLIEGFTDYEKSKVSEHFDYLKRLAETGTVLLAGRTMNTDSGSFGIVIFQSPSIEDARKIVSSDPAVANRIFRAELFPYRNALISNDSKRWES